MLSSAAPGMTFPAPGRGVRRPTVATMRSSARPCASTARTSSAAAHSASRRSAMGTVPAWPASPSRPTSIRLCPAIAVTTPTGSPRRSSTGPCSMWTSQ